MRILFLSRWFPYPPDNGSRLRVYNLLSGLARFHQVTLLSFCEETDGPPDVSGLDFCEEVQVVGWKPFDPRTLRSTLGFFSLKPRAAVDTFSPEMERRVKDAVERHKYDLVIASQIGTSNYASSVRDIPALFEEVEVAVLYEQYACASSLRHRFRHGLTWLKFSRYLNRLLANFRACTVVSEQERRLLKQHAAPDFHAVAVIPNCVNLKEYRHVRGPVEPNTLIFTGSFSFSPNYEAMVWFLREVYPHVVSQIPGLRLTITGNHCNRPLPEAENVRLTGRVDDIRPLVTRSWSSVVPLHSGGGTRLKILEAMALGTPVVTTSKGAEGLQVADGVHVLIADSPREFAQAVTSLLKTPELRKRLADNAYQLVSRKYDWGVVMPRFLDLVEQLARTENPSTQFLSIAKN